MEISYYEIPSKNDTFGNETILTKVFSMVIPNVGEVVGFEDFPNLYRVKEVSYWYSYQDDENTRCTIEILVYKE